MLLVDHGHPQRREADRLLDQGMRADRQGKLAGRELGEQIATPARGRRSRQQADRYQLCRQQRLDGREVLLGERLGGRHERRLHPVLDGPEHRVESDDSLSGADFAHQQPLHRSRQRDVLVDSRERPPLVPRQLERQQLREPAGGQTALGIECRRRGRPLPRRAAGEQRQLGQQQLLIGQPLRRSAVGAAAKLGEMRGPQRCRTVGQPPARAQRRRQRLEHIVERGGVLAHQRQDLGGGKALGRRVVGDGSVVADGFRAPGVRLDLKAAARAQLAVEDQPRPRLVTALEPGLIEEGRLHPAGAVGDGGLNQRTHAPAAHGAGGDPLDLDENRRALPHLERAQGARFAPITRQVIEQVSDGPQPERLGSSSRLGAVQRQRRRETRGARVVDRSVLNVIDWQRA